MSRLRFWQGLILVWCLLGVGVVQAAAKPLKVAFYIPRTANDMFYSPVVGFLQAAARDLDVQIELLEADNNHLRAGALFQQALQRPRRPDGMIVVSLRGSGLTALELAEPAQVPVLIENGALLESSAGAPREKFRYYVGEMLPDEEMAGYALAKYLFAKGRKASNGKVQVVALNGQRGSSASEGREKGLRRAVAEFPSVELKQIVNAEWEPDLAGAKFKGLMQRYPEASVVWAASDGMALGAVAAAQQMQLRSGKDFVIGGVDWSAAGIQAVRDGQLQATAGGHFMEAAWALVVMSDYLRGIDFSATEGVRMKTDMILLTAENLNAYSAVLDAEAWGKLDFKRLSKLWNPAVKRYNFRIQNVLQLSGARKAGH